jgi:hypothetical protein
VTDKYTVEDLLKNIHLEDQDEAGTIKIRGILGRSGLGVAGDWQ